MRYYFYGSAPTKTLLYIQLHATAGTGSGSSSGSGNNGTASTYTSDGNLSSVFSYTGGAGIGITHFIAKNIGLDVALTYNYASNSSTNVDNTNTTISTTGVLTTKTNNYNLSSGDNSLTLNAGFHFFIDHK